MLLVVQSVTYGETTVSMSPSSVVPPAVGGQLTFSINITGGMDVASFAVFVTFDSTALSYVSIASGGYLVNPVVGGLPEPPSGGTVKFGESTFAGGTDGFVIGANGDGTLATVTFRVVEVKDSTVGLSAILANSRYNPIGVTVRGASVTRTATQTGGTPTASTGLLPLEPNPTVFFRVLGDNQSGVVGEALAKPFVVGTQDRGGDPLEGVRVVFTVLTGGGSLSAKTVSTDAKGRAESTLTLGSEPGTNTVQVSAHGTSRVLIFRAEGTLPPVPTTLSIISGDNQSGVTGEALANPFVVEVRDENSNPLENVTVNFAVLTGGGTLSATTGTTDANGQAESTLTLGSEPGANTVEVSAENSAETVTFNAEAVLPPPTPTTLSIVPGLTNETPPFVVQVHDQDGNPLEDVTVTFTILGNDGSTSTTTVMTDENGRAAFTLPPGTDPGTYTITGSVEGVAETVTSTAVAVSHEFDLSLPSGFSLIHIPLKVKLVNGMAMSIESVFDLYNALGGTDTVNWLITHDPQTQTWHGYFGDADRESVANRALTEQIGILANIKAPISVRLSGDALGTNGTSTLILTPGLNLVGLPLRDSRITRVSDLFALEGIGDNITAIVVTDNGEFKVVGRAGDPGDIPITGGQSFILTVQGAATVDISGEGWNNTASGTMAAPPMTMRGIQTTGITPVLALNGSIVDGVNGINSAGLHVIVKNLSTGSAVTTVIGDAGDTSSQVGYRLTVVDIKGGRAAAIGDTLEISVKSPDTSIGVQPLRYTVTAEDVRRSRVQLPVLFLQEVPAKTQLLRNYPNPFNPETWIPYRLAEDAFVTLTIYNGSGQVVRTLDIGHQAASIYESRSKAAYWDGRNNLGESVASGLYFYTLTAGDYSDTRKMLILK